MLDPKWKERALDAHAVSKLVPNCARVFIHGACATPTPLLEALAARGDVEGLRLYHLHTAGPYPFAQPGTERHARPVSLFTGPAVRKHVAEGRADFVPVFLSDIPGLFTSGLIPLDVAIVQLSPPDRHGLCSLGPSVDAARAAVDTARIVLAEINDQMPRTHGHSTLSIDQVTAFMLTSRPLHEAEPVVIGPVEAQIGEHIAPLVPDGACLQMGIGAIPDAVLERLGDKVDLGVHTEMFSDRVVDLVHAGVINNKRKTVHRGRLTTSFVSGSKRLFDFVDDNPRVQFYPCDRTNDSSIIRDNDRVVAINSAIEIDLTGQVCADSMGHGIFSGIGGQMDFIRGAARSKGGVPIIALPSTAAKGTISRLVHELKPGAGVVTTRGHVHWVVTEYGAVNLHGRTLAERAELLISIAHPDFRAELAAKVREVRHLDVGGRL